ncbi:MAG TPA: diaminopimelate epimerase [Flavisolibacter sp.]|jgi:diaminopimelate epimerase|nr:diaminopimelate epimerase [Flavisolibacter sp.]
MQLHFFKYQGTGNDFIILDNRTNEYNLTKDQISFLCNRRFGVGADGLMLLNTHPHYDFEMKYYNADGGESSMCGNGGRCLVKFAADRGMVRQDYRFIAIDGEHEASIEIDGTVALKMNDVRSMQHDRGRFILDTGSPHYVNMVDNVMALDVVGKGREVRYNSMFKENGINVNFVQQTVDPDKIIVRTYERGVEDETFSCGTGVTAAALVCYHNETGFNHVEVKTKGGDLRVEFDKMEDNFTNIWLIGPALKVFEGTIEIK